MLTVGYTAVTCATCALRETQVQNIDVIHIMTVYMSGCMFFLHARDRKHTFSFVFLLSNVLISTIFAVVSIAMSSCHVYVKVIIISPSSN